MQISSRETINKLCYLVIWKLIMLQSMQRAALNQQEYKQQLYQYVILLILMNVVLGTFYGTFFSSSEM